MMLSSIDKKLAEDGIINIVAQISQANQKIIGKPVVYKLWSCCR